LKQRYRLLLNTTSRVVGQAKRFGEEIARGVKRATTALKQLTLEGLRQELDEMSSLVKQVMKQTRARIFHGNTCSEGKLLSLFEPSTEVIRKGKAAKPNEFGKMVKLQEAENQIITDYYNEAAAKAKGVKRVCIPNRSTKSAERKREQKKRWFRDGQNSAPDARAVSA
jgi:IS5 family transposase